MNYLVVYGVTPGKTGLMQAELLLEGDDTITISENYEELKALAKEQDATDFIVIDAADLVSIANRVDQQLLKAAQDRVKHLEALLRDRDGNTYPYVDDVPLPRHPFHTASGGWSDSEADSIRSYGQQVAKAATQQQGQ